MKDNKAVANEPTLNKKKRLGIPDAYVLIFILVFVAFISTYIVPPGQFEVEEIPYDNNGKEMVMESVDPESFKYYTDENGKAKAIGSPIFSDYYKTEKTGFFNYVYDGLLNGDKEGTVGIIMFILVIGGSFGIILKTGAIEQAIWIVIRKIKGKEFLIIPILFPIFSLGGAVFGMGEEAIPFAIILVPLFVGLKYDSVTAILVSYGATQIGFATSWMNPFGLVIAQGIAGIPVLSGSGFRIVMWIFFTIVGTVWTMYYARKIKRNPEKSIAYKTDDYFRNDLEQKGVTDITNMKIKFGAGEVLILLTILAGMVWVIWGVVANGWYVAQIAAQFFTMGVVSGIIGMIFKCNGMTPNGASAAFRKGAEDLVGPAIILGMAQGILLVLGGASTTDFTVVNTILHGMSDALMGVPETVAASGMYVFQALFNFLVCSGPGQAAITMPIMAPLSDMLDVSRQVSCLAFQLGDGFTNLINPTSACLMAFIGIARIDFLSWAKGQIKFQGILFGCGLIFVIIAVLIGYN